MSPDTFGLYPAPVPQTWSNDFPSAAEFFEDIPWSGVLVSRLAEFSHRPMYTRGGLLGGSSKLAKLAALRKQKEQDKQAAAQDTNAGRSIAILDRLGPKKENDKDLTVGLSTISLDRPKPTFPSRQKRVASPIRESEPKIEEKTVPVPAPRSELLAQPSVFARTIFGQKAPNAGGASLDGQHAVAADERSASDTFTLPFLNPGFLKRNPFSGPSPDDIVLRAQSKGHAHT